MRRATRSTRSVRSTRSAILHFNAQGSSITLHDTALDHPPGARFEQTGTCSRTVAHQLASDFPTGNDNNYNNNVINKFSGPLQNDALLARPHVELLRARSPLHLIASAERVSRRTTTSGDRRPTRNNVAPCFDRSTRRASLCLLVSNDCIPCSKNEHRSASALSFVHFVHDATKTVSAVERSIACDQDCTFAFRWLACEHFTAPERTACTSSDEDDARVSQFRRVVAERLLRAARCSADGICSRYQEGVPAKS